MAFTLRNIESHVNCYPFPQRKEGLIEGNLGSVAVLKIRAGVAQLVEHNVANVVVVGSRPITRSTFFAII